MSLLYLRKATRPANLHRREENRGHALEVQNRKDAERNLVEETEAHILV